MFFFGARCKRGRHLYTTNAPSCCIPAPCCHLLSTLQTISITVVNLQDNRVVFRIFTALLRFSFDSPSYIYFIISVFMPSDFVEVYGMGVKSPPQLFMDNRAKYFSLLTQVTEH